MATRIVQDDKRYCTVKRTLVTRGYRLWCILFKAWKTYPIKATVSSGPDHRIWIKYYKIETRRIDILSFGQGVIRVSAYKTIEKGHKNVLRRSLQMPRLPLLLRNKIILWMVVIQFILSFTFKIFKIIKKKEACYVLAVTCH